MGISNKHGPMVLATGNKSEYAAGYSTLYGDMCGGYAPLKDMESGCIQAVNGVTRICPAGRGPEVLLSLKISSINPLC